MNTPEKILRFVVLVALGIIVFYSLKCIIPRIKLKKNIEENLTIEYCKPIFTSKGTEVSISPIGIDKYLSIDQNSSMDNVILSSVPSDSWELERVIDRKSFEDGNNSGFYHNYTKPSRCSVFIKTKTSYKKDKLQYPTFLYHYLTRNNKENFVPGVGNNYVSASLFGHGSSQVWYVIDISGLPVDGAYGDTVSLGKALGDDNTRFVFIVSNPVAFKNNKEDANTQFLTSNIEEKKDKYSFGSATLTTEPTESSIWQINIKKKGTVNPLPDYKPTLNIDEYPNKDNKEFSTFMNTYLPIWNRTWYTNDTDGQTKSFTVKLCSPDYKINSSGEYSVKTTSATGFVTFDNFPGSLKGASYSVTSQGSDMLYGTNTKDKSTIILQMVPQKNIPSNGATLPGGVPTIKGWILPESGNGAGAISICASNDKNFSGVCLSPNKPNSFQQFLIKKDFMPLNASTNFNLTGNIEGFKGTLGVDGWKETVNYKCTKYPPIGNLKNCLV